MAHSTVRLTRGLLTATVITSGFAWAVVDRALVATPAWRDLGPEAWASFSRQADLGAGLVVYPVYGVGLVLLALATALSHRLDPEAPRRAGAPIYLTALFALGVIASTVVAAPIMLGLDDPAGPAETARAFHRFTLWGVQIRGVLALLAFLTSVWALATYPRASRRTRDGAPP